MTKFMIKPENITKCNNRMDALASQIKNTKNAVDSVGSGLGNIGLSQIKPCIDGISNKINTQINNIDSLSGTLKNILQKYKSTELSICGNSSAAANGSVAGDGSASKGPSSHSSSSHSSSGHGGGHSHSGNTTKAHSGGGGSATSGSHGRANVQTTDPDSGLPDGYAYGYMGQIPISPALWDRIYGPNGLASIHGSLTPPAGYNADLVKAKYVWLSGPLDFIGLSNGDLLNNFFYGDGSDYYYDATQMLLNGNVYDHATSNLESVASYVDSCNLADGETITLSVTGLCGCESFIASGNDLEDLANAGLHANTFTSINAADASIVCEVTRNGDQYTMNYNYYIVDYYDWDKNIMEDLYNLNAYGYANNFLGIGETSGEMTWDAGSGDYDINFSGIWGK